MVGYNINYSVDYLFPIPIHSFYLQGFEDVKDGLINYAYDFKKRDPIGRVISNRGGWQSPMFNVDQNNDLLHTVLINFFNKIPFIKRKIGCAAWININKSGDYNIKHSHPGAHLSGVLWIKTPENCGDVEFYSPTYFKDFQLVESYVDEFRNNSNCDHNFFYEPIEGRMLLFPSHLEHQVLESNSNEDRISVSFNIKIC